MGVGQNQTTRGPQVLVSRRELLISASMLSWQAGKLAQATRAVEREMARSYADQMGILYMDGSIDIPSTLRTLCS